MAATASAPPADLRPAKSIIYCGVCSLPPEYCEYGGTTKKCSDWLSTTHPALHNTLYNTTDTAPLSTLTPSALARAEKDAQKKAAKASATEAKETSRRLTSRVTIKRVERNKRKYVTEVSGLEAFGLELKKVAKELGKKFATGSSVTKAPGGLGEEITVQGDVSEEIAEWLGEKYGEAVPEDNVDLVEDKKKKGAGAGP